MGSALLSGPKVTLPTGWVRMLNWEQLGKGIMTHNEVKKGCMEFVSKGCRVL